jgi:hypothetical protein
MIKKHLLAAAIAAAMSAGMIASGMTAVFAADDPPAGTEASAKDQSASTEASAKDQSAGTEASAKDQSANEAAEKDFVKVSEDALISMRDLHAARLAIFNGQPERARTYVDAAVTRIGAAVRDAEQYALDTKAPKAEDSYIPFDANLTVLNAFEPTKEKEKHIAKANEHLHKGNKKDAIEALKLAEIDVAVTTSMIPVNFAKEHIELASKLVSEGKYYEANLALKAVDDAAVVETFAIDDVPNIKAQTKG